MGRDRRASLIEAGSCASGSNFREAAVTQATRERSTTARLMVVRIVTIGDAPC